MSKMIAGLAAGVVLAMGGMASAECVSCPTDYDLHVSVNGNPFFGKWAMVDDRPYVGIEALSDALNIPRKHYYKAWNITDDAGEAGDPLMLMTTADTAPVKTIRFGGVTMVDLYGVANALGMPVHHNFTTKTFQIGSDYTGEQMKGAWYRYMARTHGWRLDTDLNRMKPRYKTRNNDMQWDDLPWEAKHL